MTENHKIIALDLNNATIEKLENWFITNIPFGIFIWKINYYNGISFHLMAACYYQLIALLNKVAANSIDGLTAEEINILYNQQK